MRTSFYIFLYSIVYEKEFLEAVIFSKQTMEMPIEQEYSRNSELSKK